MMPPNEPEVEPFDAFMTADNIDTTTPPLRQQHQTPMMDDTTSFAPIATPLSGPMINDNNTAPRTTSSPQDVNNGGDNQNQTFLSKIFSCLTVEGYRVYFDVSTADIQHRVVGTLRHFNDMGGMKEHVLQGKSPDAYGPFWIATTLVFFVAVTSNMSAYLHAEEKSSFEYDVSHLFHAMILLYSYTFVLPVIYYFLFNCLNVPMTFMDLLCLYGYSLVPYCITSLFCVIPDNALVWFLLICSTTISLIFVLRNVVGAVMQGGNTRQGISGPILCSVIGCHVVFLLILKLGFYHHVTTVVS